MNSIVGFTALYKVDAEELTRAIAAQEQALDYFKWLKRTSIEIGHTRIDVWGHGKLESRLRRLPDGTLLALIGSPVGECSLETLDDRLAEATLNGHFELPWDGRFILLRISADGECWTTWNDWCGSIPLFHHRNGAKRFASTLEPLVVAAAGYSADDIFLPGLVSLLINGHYLGDWSLFKGMKIVPPDCVAEWDESQFCWRRLGTVRPSDGRWDRGLDKLTREMYELSRQAILDVLKARPSWILPLSAGLDSRLIAAVAAEIGVEIRSYTYGHWDWVETIHARQVARELGLPWQQVKIPPDFLVRYTRMWLDWFGSALHCHGMYQMPLLESLRYEPAGPILGGYIGEALAGLHVRELVDTHSNTRDCRPLMRQSIHWTVEETRQLFAFPIDDVLEEVLLQLEKEINNVDGALFQRLMFLDFWNRQRLFIYYQPTMYDYWRGVATPYLNRQYASFCMSLPRLALEDRLLQKEMIRRHYPRMAAIGGTYGNIMISDGRYILKQALAGRLPRTLRRGPLLEFSATGNLMNVNALRSFGKRSLWPLNRMRQSLGQWLNLDMLEGVFQKAANGDEAAYEKLLPIQTLAFRGALDGLEHETSVSTD